MEDGIFVDGHKVERTYDNELKIGPYTFSKKGKGMSIDGCMFSPDTGVSFHEIDIQAEIGYSLLEKLMRVVNPEKLDKKSKS